jgi:hypothetical protein
MAFDAAPTAFRHLMFSDGREEAGRRPAFLVGLVSEARPRCLDGGKPQFVEQQVDACGVDGLGHVASPMRALSRRSS